MYENYCKLRDSRGLKDADVVRGTGITKSTFSSWKTGKYVPKNEKLQKIADFFDVPIDFLIYGNENDAFEMDAREKRVSECIKKMDKLGLDLDDLELFVETIIKMRK